ncbi:hypothetical protein BT63DRAFT_458249 [Microthyrium microscopicum]|uniref:Uncharacterized protein n=1 Tax=Microthyrium microscopicum TaxID=703497 RepID=A0A6A6U0R2_9PEZI|nr:hypothetical protein BT63DRAFT_458249 [Microthyrium microscopicum]
MAHSNLHLLFYFSLCQFLKGIFSQSSQSQVPPVPEPRIPIWNQTGHHTGPYLTRPVFKLPLWEIVFCPVAVNTTGFPHRFMEDHFIPEKDFYIPMIYNRTQMSHRDWKWRRYIAVAQMRTFKARQIVGDRRVFVVVPFGGSVDRSNITRPMRCSGVKPWEPNALNRERNAEMVAQKKFKSVGGRLLPEQRW